MAAPPHVERLLDLDWDLAEALDPDVLDHARPRVLVPVFDLPPGDWTLDDLAVEAQGTFATLILEGLVVREVALARSVASTLLGPSDVLPLRVSGERLLPASVRLTTPATARVAILGDGLLPALAAWPGLAQRLMVRAAAQAMREGVHRAIAQLPRLEDRLLALFWHLGECWGRMTAAGVMVPLDITHEALGRLVGARRPTVSLALKQLAAAGALTRRADGSWLLHPDSAFVLRADGRVGAAGVALAARQAARIEPPAAREARRVAAFVALISAVHELRDQHRDRVDRTQKLIERCRATRGDIAARRAAGAGFSQWPAP